MVWLEKALSLLAKMSKIKKRRFIQFNWGQHEKCVDTKVDKFNHSRPKDPNPTHPTPTTRSTEFTCRVSLGGGVLGVPREAWWGGAGA